jgi:hypothetical protein
LAIWVLADLGQDLTDRLLDTTVGRVLMRDRRAGDVARGEVRLADLILDLVDETPDVVWQLLAGRSGHAAHMLRYVTGS